MADPELYFFSYSGALHLMFNPVIYLFIAGATAETGIAKLCEKPELKCGRTG